MCGILACFLADPNAMASPELFEGLGILQHRGQDAAGMITCGTKGRLHQCKGTGMVRDVFEESQLVRLSGSSGVAHARYPTAGTQSTSEAQPFYVNSPYGLVLAHNGTITNADSLASFLDKTAHRHLNTNSDSEVLLNIFAAYLGKLGKARVDEEDVFVGVEGVMNTCKGGFACTAMVAGFGIIGFRDPNGIRPLVVGRRRTNFQGSTNSLGQMKYDYMFASESVVLDVLGYTDVRDVMPGEAIIITKQKITSKQVVTPLSYNPCIFEFVYFSRPDSIMDGISVYKSRLAMGEALADQLLRIMGENHGIDVVIPVPDTSRVAALQLATKLSLTYREGFIKNRYVGRTFIMPGQSQRQKSVRRKLNPMPMEFADKNVLLVDDSVVRGTTSKEIVLMARDCGAKKVYFASCAPPIRFPNVYGIDMPSRSELVASGRTEQQVAEEIGADLMIYQDLDDLSKACLSVLDSSPRALISPHNSSHRDPGEWYREPYKITGFDMSVFDGKYITGDITPEFLNRLESNRGASTKNPVLIPSHSKRDSPRVGSPSVTSHHPPLELLGSSYSTSEFDLEIARHKIPGMNGDETPPRIRDAETVGLHNNYSRR